MANDAGETTGIFGGFREASAALIESLGLRLELFGLELQQEKRRVFATVFLAMSASLAGFMALLFANLAIVVTFWEHRLFVCIALVGLYLVMALVCSWVVRSRLSGRRTPFPATLGELRKDAETVGVKSASESASEAER